MRSRPWIWNAVLFLVGAVISYIGLIAPFLALMVVTGGAVFAVPVIVAILGGAAAIDHFALGKGQSAPFWPLTAAASGLVIAGALLSLTSGPVA